MSERTQGPGDEYLIWSQKHGGWRDQSGQGYQPRPYDARRHTWDEAIDVCSQAMLEAGDSDTVIPVREVDLMSVEFQVLRMKGLSEDGSESDL